MKPQVVLVAAFFLVTIPALAADGNFDRSLTVSGTPTVSVFSGSGYVHISPGAEDRVRVTGHVHLRAGWLGLGADTNRIKQVVDSPPILQAGDIITIGISDPDSDRYRDVSIDYDVTVPRTTSLHTRSGSGELRISGIDGVVSADSGSGSIRAENLGLDAHLSAGSGSVHADNIGPNGRLETASGSIRAINVRGAATVRTGSGSLELNLTAAGDIKANSSSGSIRIKGVSGGLRAGSSSGSIEVAGNPTSEWHLESGSGSIHVALGDQSHFTLNVETGSGSIRVDRPNVMQGAFNPHHVSGTVNGGGPTVRITTGSGGVTIR
jgi:Putative adhesin